LAVGPDRAANWRRKWRRADPARRATAAESLNDLFTGRRRRGVGVLWLVLVLAAALHGGLLPLARRGEAPEALRPSGRDTYLRKVVQKERAVRVARHLARQVSMPPPPPVPESVIGTKLATEISTDIERVIGDATDVKVSSELARQVTSSLRDELAAAAKDIAEGKLSAKEIGELQQQFRRKAHRRTVTALRTYREKTQVARAKMSVKEWYERNVSRTLRGRLRFELFTAGHRAWSRYGGDWGFLNDRWYAWKVDRLRELARGEHYAPDSGVGGRPGMHNRRMLPDWPKATRTGAEGLLRVLDSIYRHSPRHTYQPTWDQAVARYVDDFYPHRREDIVERHVKPMVGLWRKLFEQARAYRDRAGDDADPAAAARKACFETARALRDAAAGLIVSPERRERLAVVNRALRSRVLRGPRRERAYQHLVAELAGALAPGVREMARNEFGEGILIRRKGIDDVASEFAGQIMVMLRRDVEKAFPKPRFDERIFEASGNPYRSKVDGQPRAPTPEEVRKDEAALAAVAGKWSGADRAYVPRRTKVLAERLHGAVDRVVRAALSKIISEGRLAGRSYGCPPSLCFYRGIDSVDYTDKVKQRLDARARALAGRGQDLARLTPDGVPDTSASMIALMLGAAKGHGASLEPIPAGMAPAYVSDARLAAEMRAGPPMRPPPPAGWGRVTQPEVKPGFDALRAEGIPFLANFPRLDGDLTDWGRIRPLVTQRIQGQGGPDEETLIYAAWNYQGFFFGYHVTQPGVQYAHPRMWYQYHEKTGVIPLTAPDYHWAYSGDFLRLLFDTLDARGEWRGEPHTQEFVILPRGTEMHPNIPGIERVIASVRDASRRRRGSWMPSKTRIFPPQPDAAEGPDGTGPYRVTRFDKDGYTVEVFLPRSLFNRPVFAPGWWIGFEAMVGVGRQPRYHCAMHGRIWANPRWHGHGDLGDKDHPDRWGDLLLLGTDPRLAVQAADAAGSPVSALVPGHSYLLTVIDPDRNVYLTARDAVVVSAEIVGAGDDGDVEVYLLKETGRNTSVFRGYVNTQPGRGRKVRGVLEAMPARSVRFGYVDLANAEGTRNVVYRLVLPVVAAVTRPSAAR